jgi:hypothetical protein
MHFRSYHEWHLLGSHLVLPAAMSKNGIVIPLREKLDDVGAGPSVRIGNIFGAH